MPFIAFDLEGPLTPHDHAYELMGLFPGGDRVFEVISRYDDLVTLEGREGYEPGDTLALIAPFLLLHGLGTAEMELLAGKAGLVSGAAELVNQLLSRQWQVCCITTTYQPYALALARRMGIPPERVAATPFPPAGWRKLTAHPSLRLVAATEAELASLRPGHDDDRVKRRLDRFFLEELAATPLGSLLEQVKPVGGRRKVAALQRLSSGLPLSQTIAVGDSITDFHMLKAVDKAGGLAVAFNANQYALPYATVSLASSHISDLLPLLETWEGGGRKRCQEWVQGRQGHGEGGYFHWQPGQVLETVLPLHREFRHQARSRAALLG